jgi:nitrilase
LAALQIGSNPAGTPATLEKLLGWEAEIAKAKCDLVVIPEALLGGYPKGQTFGAPVGFRLPEGRDAFAAYHAAAIDVPGDETEELEGLAARTGAALVVGAIERSGGTLYCVALYIDPEQGLVGHRRKLMPTGSERLIWGQGSAADLSVMKTRLGTVVAAICWENYMPLLRTTFYEKRVDVWCAPTVDERDIWQCSMRHIAAEGRCFVVSACQVQPSPMDLGQEVPGWPADRPLINGGSVIVSPMGEVLAGPCYGIETLLTADVDMSELVRARYDLDVVGHYSRPDIFELRVRGDEAPSPRSTLNVPAAS